MRIIRTATVALAVTCASLHGQELEVALIPVATTTRTVHGALGSEWKTEFWVHNASDHEVLLKYLDPLCLHISPCGEGDVIGPGRSSNASATNAPFLNHPEFAPSPPGVLVYYPRAVAESLHFHLRVRDLSREAESAGTEIPVVREPDFLTEPVHLLNVPTDSRFRTHLRLYGPDEKRGHFLVRVHDLQSGMLLAEEFVELERHPVPAAGFNPDYAEIAGLTKHFPEISSAESVRVAIEPLTPGLRYWAFISVTDNETQQVTVITPQ